MKPRTTPARASLPNRARRVAVPIATRSSWDGFLKPAPAAPKDPGAAADCRIARPPDAGLAKARYNLGALYYSGEGVPKDPRVAAEWYSKAAYQNHAGAQFNLAALYETGDGVPKSLSEARKWYTEVVKSADKQLAADAQEALDKLGRRRR